MLINLRNALMAGKRNPYQCELEYIESTGSQYIDTGIFAAYNMKITADCQYVSNTSATQVLFGPSENGGNWFGNISGKFGVGAYKPQQCGTSTTRAVIDFTWLTNDTTVTNVTTGAVASYGRAITLTQTNNIRIFGAGGITSYLSYARVYYLKIIDENSNLVADYIPVLDWDGKAKMFDKVTGTYPEHYGTFVAGPDVVPVEYIESHGTEWIDTGVVPAANDTYTVETRKLNVYQDNASFGLAGCVYCFSNGKGLTGYGTHWGHIALGQGGIAGVNPLGDTNWHTIVASPTSVSVDGVALGNRTGGAQSPLSTVKLFARGNNSASGGVAKQYNGMISHAFVNRGGLDLRKFYAVRVGTDATSWEGAMMDVLTRRIYRNAGTGAFTYGNDLKYPIPAE